MEQDIKNLTEIIELSKEEIENNNENVTAILDLEDLKSLKNILDNYNLIKISKEETEELLENSIPTSKIQDKIDELKENTEEYKKWKIKGIETDVDYYDNIADVRTVQVLEELLKGE